MKETEQGDSTYGGNETFDLEQKLLREKGQDLIGIDPKTLSLTGRLRQRRQMEKKQRESGVIMLYPETEEEPIFESIDQEIIAILADINMPELDYIAELHNPEPPFIHILPTSETIIELPTITPFTKEKDNQQDYLNRLILSATKTPEEILSKRKLEYYDLLQQNLSAKEISIRLGVSVNNVYQETTHIRNIFEEQRLSRLGILPLSFFQESSRKLTWAASENRLVATKFLEKFYSMKEFVDNYQPNSRAINQELLAAGFEPLKGSVEPLEYAAFRDQEKFQRFLHREDGIIYVKIAEIPLMRSMKKVLLFEPTPSPEQGLVNLRSRYRGNRRLYRKLQRALGDNLLTGVKTNEGWYVNKDDVSEFLKKNPLKTGLGTSEDVF